MNMKVKRAAAIKAAQEIIAGAKAAGRDLTAAERATLEQKRAEVEDLTARIERADADAELMKQFEGTWTEGAPGMTSALSFKGVARRVVQGTDSDGPRNIKSLLAAGSQTVETEDVGLTVIKERPPTSFMESIPQRKVAEHFSYLRQTTRTNNAAPVGVGGLKPTSVFTLTRIEDRLKVVAHLSEAIPEYWLSDAAALEQFVNGEMVTGLAEAVAAQAISGDGTGENLQGFAAASGIQTVAFTTDAIGTVRRGIGALETLGLAPALIVMNPTDWLAMELTRTDGATGGYLLNGQQGGAPLDRVRRQLWSVPVALSTGVTAGTAYVISEDSLVLFHDGQVSVKWGVIGDDFGRNQVRCRAEGRFQMGVTRPIGIVQVTLTGV
jgi:HK97 family phage major capsid protein